ncbi:D-2-hydroxyacid dehydrogenase [Clostridium aciditolerans]|uniref:2-oxoglutarate reductase n=1 Tax=Clostridium aciditolerans TaxID=339861 RepID=A0A934I2N9_9CLOT|nr:D-2-hydroxyacid dehydrogenase [Clostridium aciditolerans]MBI6875722.1 D-2-hydroxyacid dehydrogenase [Clostridium aciditolerans]
MIKILVCDGMEKEAIKKLIDGGFEVVDKHYEEEELKKNVMDFDIMIVRSATKVRKPIIDAAKGGKLKLIIRGGVGVDNIDVDYARKNGIEVRNTPNASSASVAELTIGHLFALTRYIHLANVTMRDGKWEKKKYEGIELFGKTLGLIGFGRIAREVATRAEALGIRVIYTDKLGKARGYERFEFCTIEKLLKNADFVSLHVPFNKEEGAIIGKDQFAIMKDGAYIINCARGGVIDEEALMEALNSGKINGAGLDVFENEPKPNLELVNHPKVCVTPHIGGSTEEAQERIGEEIVETIEEFFQYNNELAVNA